MQPADPYTFTLGVGDILDASLATQKIGELCSYLTVVGTETSNTTTGVPGSVVGVCLADGTVVSTFDKTTMTLTVSVEKDKSQSVYLLLSVA